MFKQTNNIELSEVWVEIAAAPNQKKDWPV